ncbi:hypothetical protein JMM61_19965 [Rhodovulum sulfidophilum]|nr:hypothetical protein [Rhodovulum sulfidophilum]
MNKHLRTDEIGHPKDQGSCLPFAALARSVPQEREVLPEGLILLKNSSLLEVPSADSIPALGGRIGDDGTAAGGAAGAFLRVLA